MKHKVSLVLFLCTLLFVRCREDEVTVLPSFSPESAVEWYETHYPDPLRFKLEEEYVATRMTPHWESARFAGDGWLVSMEVELLADGTLQHLPRQVENTGSPSVRNASSQPVYSLTRLILLADEETGEQVCFLMVVVPTEEYYALYPEFYDSFSYFDRSPDFSGRILYYNPEGEFVNGWEYDSGAIIARLTPFEGLVTRSTECSGVLYQVDEYYCWYSYVVGHEDDIHFECQLHDSYWLNLWRCQETGGGGGGYDGGLVGGGGRGGNGGKGPTQRESALKTITQKITLEEPDSIKLEESLREVDRDCAFKQMLAYLDSAGFKLEDVLVDTTMSGNASFTSGNMLKFLNSDEITAENLTAELIHAYQFSYHRQNGNNYTAGGDETGAMEFEQRLLVDLIAYKKDPKVYRSEWACRVYEDGTYKIESTYKGWLKSLLGEKKTYPTSIDMEKFNEFDQLFRQSHPSYAHHPTGVTYTLSITKLFEMINANCK